MRNTFHIGDNLGVLRGMDSASVDLVYLDPPFGKQQVFGFAETGRSFSDVWAAGDCSVHELSDSRLRAVIEAMSAVSRHKGARAYLSFMAARLVELRRVLRDTGSIYLHCDTTASHKLKLIMDAVFGEANFKNEIVWRGWYGPAKNTRYVFPRNHDVIFLYGKTARATFRPVWLPLTDEARSYYKLTDERGRFYYSLPTVGDGEIKSGRRYEFRGVVMRWILSPESMERLYQEGRLVFRKGKWYRKLYLHEAPGIPVADLWVGKDTVRTARADYPTQKPLALLNRVIGASSNEGDVVLDPFCGSGTACVSARNLGRDFIGIDSNPCAIDIALSRIKADIFSPTPPRVVRHEERKIQRVRVARGGA